MKINDFGSRWNNIINKIKTVANENGLHVYIVGGFVRDLLLQKNPKDLDLMVSGLENGGIKLGELVHAKYPNISSMTSDAGKSFGVSKLHLDGEEIDLVCPRKEIYQENNRKPQVSNATLAEDAKRRDFSVNALFIDLNNNEIMDLTGNGLRDLKDGILRVADPENPDIIMTQDPLRMLRLIRQASQLNFSIDPATYDSVKRNAAKITTISKERIQEELNKMLMTDKPSRALSLLKQAGLLDYILTDLNSLKKTEEEGGTGTKDVWAHTLQVVDNAPKNLVVRLAALFHDIGKPETKSRTYIVTCPKCAEKIDYIFKTQPEIGIKCQNGSCGGNLSFKTESDLYNAFPNYEIHFYDHEKAGALRASKALRDLRYSDDIIQEVMALITHHMKAHGFNDDWTESAVRRYQFETQPYTQNLLDLTKSDITTKHPDRRQRRIDQIEKLRERIRLLNEKEELAKIQSPLDGNELMQMYPGRKPGEWLKKIKNYLLNEVIEGRLAQGDKSGATRLLQNIDIDKLASDNSIIKLSWRDL